MDNINDGGAGTIGMIVTESEIAFGVTTFTFDNSKTIPKGTTLTLFMQCNLSSSAKQGSTYQWTLGSITASVASRRPVEQRRNSDRGSLVTVSAN